MLKPYIDKNLIEAGCDESGRGCLAGPIVAASVILPKGFHHSLLNDSKKLTPQQRNILRPIIEKEAISFGIGLLSPKEIDKYNILRASFMAMHCALDQLQTKPEQILVDGNRFIPYKNIPYHCIIKGDSKLFNIAAASILAKTYRDEYMYKLAKKYPNYNWHSNKGYPTKSHREAIKQFGDTTHHRKTFKLLP